MLPETLPPGVVDGASVTRAIDDDVDFIVVGTGAAGAVAAYVLADAGHSVAMIEEGPWVHAKHFGTDVYSTFQNLVRDAGMTVMKGRSFIPFLQGMCVGGSTVINSAIAWRAPEDVFASWSRDFGLDVTAAAIDPHYAALEKDLSVREVAPAVLGENNRLFLEAAKNHGVEAAPMRRYDAGCEGSGRCLQGCANGKKQSMAITYVPWALDRGARLFASCKVTRVDVRGGRAVGVSARTSSGARVAVRAKKGVLVAASTVQTPNLLRRSGVRARALGDHFQCHPSLGIGGLFDAPISMDFGATQGAESIHFRKTHRVKLETIGMPPELAAARIPGLGRALTDRLASLGHVAVWAGQVRSRAEGSVTRDFFGRDLIRFTPTKEDVEGARMACALLAHWMLDAGAREIWPGIYGIPSVLTSHDDVKLIEEAPLEPRNYGLIATHLFGAARASADPNDSVCDPTFQTREVDRLFVVDSSVFPTNLGVNPQHTIMAVARLIATRLAEEATRVAAA
jgi:choline dehydrogenase-like flavoprotein